MIIGIGTDLVRIDRIAKSLNRFGDDFARRLLTSDEFSIFLQHKDKATYLASRFAAKEAVVKALGTGFIAGLRFAQIGVKRDSLGKPEVYFSGRAEEMIRLKQVSCVHITLSHEKDFALAFVVFES